MTEHKHLQNICIVGNIASGKSTLTELLAAALPDSLAIPERFQENRFLQPYIGNPRRWGFTNAVRYFYDYVRAYRELVNQYPRTHYFIDAGGATNRQIYGQYLLAEGIMTLDEHAFYDVLCDLLVQAYAYPEPDAYVFVEASPEICFERMRARGWGYQDNIQLEYLNHLRKYIYAYEVVVTEQGLPVLKLDSDALNWQSEPGRTEVVERVRAFLAEQGTAVARIAQDDAE